MKNSNLFGVIAAGLVVLTAASGCHRKPTSLTPIPGVNGPQASDNSQSLNTQPVAPENPVVAQPGGPGIPMSTGNAFDRVKGGPHDETKLEADTIHFAFDKATVRPDDESKLQDVANNLKANANAVVQVEGNCDERGTEKYNLALGDKRALAAREYLANLGIDPQRIGTISYGFAKPVDPAHNEAAWKQNRRDDFVVMTPK